MFNREIITIKSFVKVLSDGKYTETATTRTHVASIQSYEPDEILLQDFGDRFKEWVLIVSPLELKTDEVAVWREKEYRIMKSSNYSNVGFFKSAQYQALGALI